MASVNALLRRLNQHRRNLEILELQKARAGAAVPVAIENQIEYERNAIAQIEETLATLDADSIHHLNSNGVDDAETRELMDAQLSRMFSQVDDIDKRTRDLEKKLIYLENDLRSVSERMARMETQIALLQHGPQTVTRTWLLSGAVLLASVFLLVLFMAWRLL